MRTTHAFAALIVLSIAGSIASRCVGADSNESSAREGAARWIAIGGGAEPETNQVSLEQDVALARAMLGSGGRILFAGGSGTYGVQVLDGERGADSLLARLGDLFDPRGGRDARYRPTTLPADGPATIERVEREIVRAARMPGDPLLLYFATHGEGGDSARGDRMFLWGGTELGVARLAELLDGAAARRVVVVSTACYSGGFAELAFAGADPANGAAAADHCGLFASQWNEQSSGCDPNPDRRVQESYGIHFLHALRGQDRDGKPSPAIDLDGDGAVSLLEAHTHARIASRSFDVPTSTSERWLRQVAPESGAGRRVALPEEDAVVDALGRRLDAAGEPTVRARLTAMDRRLDRLEERLDDADRREAESFAGLRIALLERWPVLDDPWHPDFASTLRDKESEIEKFLGRSPAATAERQAIAELDRQQVRYDELRATAAVHRRLLRAYENRALAARLAAAGGPDWDQYERLLACERTIPGR